MGEFVPFRDIPAFRLHRFGLIREGTARREPTPPGIVTLIKDRPNLLLVLEAKSLKMNVVTTSESPRFRCKCD